MHSALHWLCSPFSVQSNNKWAALTTIPLTGWCRYNWHNPLTGHTKRDNPQWSATWAFPLCSLLIRERQVEVGIVEAFLLDGGLVFQTGYKKLQTFIYEDINISLKPDVAYLQTIWHHIILDCMMLWPTLGHRRPSSPLHGNSIKCLLQIPQISVQSSVCWISWTNKSDPWEPHLAASRT